MKFRLFIVLYILSPLFLFSQDETDKKIIFDQTEYDPFFSAEIRDNDGEVFSVSNLAFYDEFNDRKYFFWVRRNSGLYSLSFRNIKKITFEEGFFSDEKYINYTKCNIELVSGEEFQVYLKTTGHLEGTDETFASPVTFYLHYNLIRSIEFRHNGEYKYCDFCGTFYFDSELERCPYDKTPLKKGALVESEK